MTTLTPGLRQVHTAHHFRLVRALGVGVAAILGATAAPTTAAAQDSSRVAPAGGQPCTYDSCALRVEDGWFSRRLVRGREGTMVARLGFGGPGLASIVQRSDSAVVHARRYQSAQRTADIISLVGTVGTVVALVTLDDNTDRGEAIAVNIGSVVVFAIGQTFQFRARRELARSVWWYNRDVLAAP